MKAFPFTIPLRKLVRYPTFQLFATMDNQKTSPRDGLTLGALTMLHWLAQRLGADAPEQLRNLPPIENFREIAPESLESFRLREDFNVSVLSAPKRGVWMMQIIESDFGSNSYDPNQKRPGFPGRNFETNVSFKIVKDELRCGFQTVVREPSGAPAPDLYRLAVVRALIENPDFGLRQIVRLDEKPIPLKTGVDLDRFLSMWRGKENQLPLVVFVLGEPSPQDDFSDLLNVAPSKSQDKKNPFVGVKISRPKRGTFLHKPQLPESFRAALSRLSKKKGDDKGQPEKVSSVPEKPHEMFDAVVQGDRETTEQGGSKFEERTIAEANDFSKHLLAFGLTYLLESPIAEKLSKSMKMSVGAGDVILFEPVAFGGKIYSISGRRSEADREAALKRMYTFVHDYMRGKSVRYAGVNFITSVREGIIARAMERLKELTPKRLPGVRKDRVDDAKVKQLQSELARKNDEITARDEKLALLRSDLSSKDAEIAKFRSTIDDLKKSHAAALAAKDDLIDYLRDRMTWPESHDEIADWAEEKLKGKLVLVQHAKDLLLQKGAQSAEVGLICEALHYLATDYRGTRYKIITEDERDLRAYAKYGRGFQISPTSDATIREHPEQYRVKYSRESKKNPVDCDLTSHLRVGTGAAHLLRIYFFHDDDRQLIVVGSLPQHLKNAGE